MSLSAALLTLTWLLPLILGSAQWFWPKRVLPVASLAALPAVLTALFVPLGTSVSLDSLLLGTRLLLDETAQTFLLFSGLLWLLASLFAQAYLAHDEGRARFFAFFLWAMSGNLGLIVADDMLSFYLWFALMSFASYGLVIHNNQRAARIYMILVVIGEVLLFAGLALAAAQTSSLAISDLASSALDPLTSALIFFSFGIKAGAVGLHLWLPLAHPAAPVPASAVLSGAMIKAGVLGWLRFLRPIDASDWGLLLIVLGLLTAFYGALVGVSQTNPKAVLAYSSISQMGFIIVGVGAWLATVQSEAALLSVLLYALHHALAKGALFFGVSFAGAGKTVPLALLLPALALAGLPFTSGAVAKTALKATVDQLSLGWKSELELALSLAAVGTTLLMARFLWLIWRSPTAHKQPDSVLWSVWGATLAAVLGLVYLLPLASSSLESALKSDKWWPASWPILLGMGLAALISRSPVRLNLPLVPLGDLLNPIERLIVRFSRRVNELAGLSGRGQERLGQVLRARAKRFSLAGLGQLEL
ncbi:MAG: complex I subunit 5 family protein, partial [Anaerolineae bacterium]|nr:complex I subunit 5 family protein [Anaerolineae bacterium]